jgi:hypothetical protein
MAIKRLLTEAVGKEPGWRSFTSVLGRHLPLMGRNVVDKAENRYCTLHWMGGSKRYFKVPFY